MPTGHHAVPLSGRQVIRLRFTPAWTAQVMMRTTTSAASTINAVVTGMMMLPRGAAGLASAVAETGAT